VRAVRRLEVDCFQKNSTSHASRMGETPMSRLGL
jgi:hypothetical protein